MVTFFTAGCGKNDAEPQATAPIPRDQSAATADGTAPVQTASVTPAAPQVSATQLVQQADQLLSKRDFNNAVRTLTQAIQADPKNVDAYLRRAAILAEGKLTTQAIIDMSVAVHLQPDNAKHYNTRGYFYLLQKKYAEAQADFDKAIQLNQQYPQAHNNRGLVFTASDKHIQAIQEFKTAIRLKPDYVDAHNNLGYTCLQDGQLDQAVTALTAALKLKPNDANSLTNRASVYIRQKKYKEAIADCTKAIEFQPNNMAHYRQRSEAYAGDGQEELAKADSEFASWSKRLEGLTQAVQSSPNSPGKWVAVGEHVIQQQKFDTAIELFNQAIKVDKKCVEAYEGLARVALLQKEYKVARDHASKGLELEPRLSLYSIRGDAYYELGELEQAVEDYQKSKRIDSKVVSAMRKQGENLKTAGNGDQADQVIQQAGLIEKTFTGPAKTTAKEKPRPFVIQQAGFEEGTEE